jgi:hypothetical protein
MRVFSFASILVLTSGCVVAACGGSSSNDNDNNPGNQPPVTTEPDPTADAGTPDTSTPPAKDASTPPKDDPVDPNYPAKHAPLPIVDWNGGRVMKAPKIVTVTFPNDPMRARLEEFGDTITATPWWDAVSDGYCASSVCIGHGSGGGHVVMPEKALATYTDSQQGASTVQALIKAKVADGTFPEPTPDTLYALYFPSTTTINLDGTKSCAQGGFGGYHMSVEVTPKAGGAAVRVPYAVMPRCDGKESTTTIAASHEFIEAATDTDIPLDSGIAYYLQNQLWGLAGGEVGDLCVDPFGGDITVEESGFTVQRSWSNKSVKAGHNPCVPIPPGEVYFNVAPATEQVSLAVGKSTTVELTAFSDAPTANWSLKTLDFAPFLGGQSVLKLAIDKTSVNNGTKVKLTITLTGNPSQGYAPFGLISTSNGINHLWPMVVIP